MLSETPELINVQPSGRWSALHQAAEEGRLKAVMFLVANGANIEAKNSENEMPVNVTQDMISIAIQE
eukprot:12228304-Karenia_brevis.AAC.1